MLPQALGLRAALDREAARVRRVLGPDTDAVLVVGEFGFLNDGSDAQTVAEDLLASIGHRELWFVDVTRRSGHRGRVLDTAVRTQTSGTRRVVDVPGLLRDTGWIVLDITRRDLASLSFPFAQIVSGRALPRSTSGSYPQLGV